MFDFGNPRADRCPHNVVDYVKVDHYRTDLVCESCGELIGWLEDLKRDPNLFITGKVRELSEKEMEELV